MDYDENDFHNHNLHLAGEGSNKFPPVLLPYALPKFDFDDGLNGSLRFDSLVETEVFLGIESNEDNQWIEDFSRGTSGIQFSSSAAESCSLSRHNNVWSEATSLESVEMLLKSVVQEDNTPVQTNTKVSDACDELGCILKHMEPIFKQDSDTSPKVEDTANLQAKFLPGKDVEDFSVLDNDVGQQQPLDDSSQDHKGEASADSGLVPLVDLSATSVEVRQPVIEGSLSNDSNSNHVSQREVDDVVNGPSNDMPQKGPGSGMQDGASLHNITTGNIELTEKDGPDDINNTCDDHKDFLETNTGENQKKGHVLSQEGQMEDENPSSDAMESVEEANIIETNLSNFGELLCVIPRGHSGFPEDLVTSGQSEVDIVGGSMMAIEDDISFERHGIEDSNGSHLDNKSLSNKCEASILSSESCESAKVKVGGTSNSDTGGVSSLAAVCCSAEVVGEVARVPSPFLAESSQICEKSVAPAAGKDTTELPSGNVNTENNFIASRLQFDAASDNKSASDVSCKLANMVTCDTMDGVPMPSGDITNADADIGHKDVKMSPSSEMGFSPLDKEKETKDKISAEASLSGLETSCQLIAGLDPGPESKKGASSGASGQMVCESAEQSPLMVDACKTEGPHSEVIDKVSLKSTEEMDVCPVLCDSTADEGDDAEVLVKVNDEKESAKVSEPAVNENEMLGPISSEKEEFREDTNQKGQEENEAAIASEDNNDKKIDVPSTSDCGSCAEIGKAASGSPTVIRAAGDFQSESDKEGAKCSVEQTAVADSNASKALSASRDSKQNDASKDERSFTFEVSPLANMPEKEAGNKWQPFLNRPATKAYPILNASPSSGLVQIDPKLAQDAPCESPKVSDVAIVRSGSKGTSERKTRRPSAKAMGKDSARKGNPIKDTASVRLEKGAKTNNVSPSPPGILQHVQSNEMQRYGHVDSSTMKPFVHASSTSSLPDLNSSASPSVMFQQPFTDLQQVQLRAQIFVYGALIQGTTPDEAYMISAFGGSDGGKSLWENALRTSIDRLHGQNPHLTTPETPLQSRPGSRALDQAIKQSAIQSTVISSPIGRTSKGTPAIVNPMVPLSSPLWSVPTPTGDTFQSSSMPRGPIMDHHRALSPMHPHQTSQIRNFAGNSWISQAPFCGPWATSPQTPVLDTSCHFSAQLPITEPVQLTPVKDLSMPIISGAKHVSPGPAIQIGASASVFTGTFPVSDAKKVAASSNQPPTDPKPRKRKKTPVSESPGQNILHPHPQTEPVPAPVVTSHPSASVAITTPVINVSKLSTEKFVASVSPTPTDIIQGNQNAEQRNMLSEETLEKVKAARVQAEDAATLAAAAVSHSLEIWNQLDEQRNSGLSPDVETKLASAAAAIAAAAAVARAAAAAAKVASNAALQAKLLADEAVNSGGYSHPSQDNTISVSEGMKNLAKATPASILKGDDGTNNSSSILVVAREAARRRVEVASAAAKRAENMDAIVKAAELAAEAVSQAGKIVAMGDPSPLNELVAVGPEGYWKVAKINNELISKSNAIGRKNLNIDRVGEGRHAPTQVSTEDHARLEDGSLNSCAAAAKDVKGHEGSKVSESENSSRSLGTMENYNSIKEGSHVEVFKDGNGFKAAWFSANVVDLKDGSAYVSYTDLLSVEGSEKLKEWVTLKGEGESAPKIRIARPITAVQFEGSRKRRRAATVDRIWSVGDRADAWIQDSWREGVVIERTKNDDTTLKVQFPVQGETSVVRAWHLRPSLLWENGEWIEWSGSKVGSHSTKGDTPQEKRTRVRSPAVEAKGNDMLSKGFESVETDRHDEPTLLDLAAHEKLFNIGKSTKDGNKPDVLRMARTGLQKEGSRVIFGVPKPGKKRKFMEVSKHYVADQSSKNNEANDSVKFAKYLMPQGSRSRGWKSTLRTESIANRTVASKPKALKSGKPQNVSGRTNTLKDNSLTTVSASNDGAVTDHVAKTKASISHVENTSEKHNMTGFHPLSSSVGATEGPVFSSFPLPSGTLPSKKIPKPQRVSKGKLAPAGGKLGRIEEDKIFNGDSSKSTSDFTEPRRSNRKIQPTSRLLEGLQSSLTVSKTPSVLHDKSQKSRAASRVAGNSHG